MRVPRAIGRVSYADWKTRPIHFFNHIPKCGGTSLTRILENWFVILRDYPPHDLQFPNRDDFERAMQQHSEQIGKSLLSIRPWQIVAGHFLHSEHNVYVRYPDLMTLDRVRQITFVRDPFQQKLSLYFHGLRKNHAYIKGYSLADFICTEPNFMATCLGCSQENYKQVLDKYFFVGIVERFQQSIEILSDMLRKPAPKKTQQLNISPRNDEPSNLSEHDINNFHQINSLDYEIFNYCKILFARHRQQFTRLMSYEPTQI